MLKGPSSGAAAAGAPRARHRAALRRATARAGSSPRWAASPGSSSACMKTEAGVSPSVTAGEVALLADRLHAPLRRAHGRRRRTCWRSTRRRAFTPSSRRARAGLGTGGDTMDLNTLWFLLIGVLFIGFFVLEGFDYGVGILLPFLGRTDAERRRDHQHHRTGLGRQRGLDAHRRAGRSSPPSRTGTPPSSAASTSPSS